MFEPPEDPSPPPSTTAPGTTDPAVVDLEEVLRPRVSPRRRAAQAGVVLVGLLVVVGLLLHGIAPTQQGTASVLPTPNPPTIVIESNVNFGTVTVNGRTLKGSPPLVTHIFHFGTNVVTLSAPPFRPRTCHVLFSSDQPLADSSCSSAVGGSFEVNGVVVRPDLSLSVELGSADLPPDLAASAHAAAVQAAAVVRPHTVVPAGQYYATGLDAQGHITSRRAAAPLQADVLFGPVDPQAASGPGFCGPSQFCDVPLDPRLAVLPGWHIWSVGLGLTARWRFTPPAEQPTLSPALPSGFPIQLVLAYDGAGGWSVVTQPPRANGGPGLTISALPDELVFSLCHARFNLVTALVQQAQVQNGWGIDLAHDQGVEGCEIQVVTANNATVGTFVWRFGVLLAVDNGAHTLAPWLPLAPQAEVVAVGG